MENFKNLDNFKKIKIALAADHGGYELKEHIKEHLIKRGEFEVVDIGTDGEVSVDFPDFAFKAAAMVAQNEAGRAILVCGSGIGMCIAANKVEGVYAAVCNELYSAKLSRQHNDTNVLCIGGRIVGKGLGLEIVDTWLASPFLGGKYAARIAKIEANNTKKDIG